MAGGFAQKVNYKKDLFPLLVSGHYDQAEPMLKRYLLQNDDNPNAYLYMGLVLESKFMAADVLRQEKRAKELGDSTVKYLNLCLKGLDDRELRKNEEYYQKYNSRDQRTGDFGLNLEKITYDLGKKIQDINDRQQKIVKLNRYFNLMVSTYRRNQEKYKKLVEGFATYHSFLLKSDENTAAILRDIRERSDSVELVFKSYRSTATQMGKVGYNQELELKEIRDISTDGSSETDFYVDRVLLWNFRAFSEDAVRAIVKEIIPMNENLLKTGLDIDHLQNRLRTDSVSVMEEVSKIREQLSQSALQKYDENPLPLAVFNWRLAELETGSVICQGREVRSGGNLLLNYNRLEKEAKAWNKQDSLVSLVLKRDLANDERTYSRFVRDAYTGMERLKLMLENGRDYADRRVASINTEMSAIRERMRFIIDGEMRIPALPGVSEDGMVPLSLQPEKNTLGIHYVSHQPTAYFYLITPNRIADVKARFPLDSTIFAVQKQTFFKAQVVEAQNGNIFFPVIFSEERVDGKVPVVISKVYSIDGLAWSNLYWIDGLPDEIHFIKETGELSIRINTPAGPVPFLIPKDGKLQ